MSEKPKNSLSTLPEPIIALARKLSHLVDMEKLAQIDDLSILSEVIDLEKLEAVDPEEITDLTELASIVDMEKLAKVGDLGKLIEIFGKLSELSEEDIETADIGLSAKLATAMTIGCLEDPAKTQDLKSMYMIPTDIPDQEYKQYLKTVEQTAPAKVGKFAFPFKNYKIKGYSLNEFVLGGYFNMRNWEARDDDIYVVAFPKTGTTWMQEIAYLLAHDLNFEKAKESSIEERSVYLERPRVPIQEVAKMPGPRILKSHLPYSLLPESIKEKKCKILYVTRNPKDTIVSCYHFYRMVVIFGFTGTFEEFFDLFINDFPMYTPFPSHALEFWNRRHDSNIHFIKYEDLKKNLPAEIKKIATFLGKKLTEEQLKELVEHCSFKSMAANPATNYSQWDAVGLRKKTEADFMRKGQIGDWKNYFTEEIEKKYQEWHNERYKNSDLNFDFE